MPLLGYNDIDGTSQAQEAQEAQEAQAEEWEGEPKKIEKPTRLKAHKTQQRYITRFGLAIGFTCNFFGSA